jgi:hypothetical protein
MQARSSVILNPASADTMMLPSRLPINGSIRVNNTKTFVSTIETNIKNTKKRYKLIVDTTKSIWTLMQELVHCIPYTLKFIIQICQEMSEPESDIRKLVYCILIEQSIARLLNDPIKNKVIDGCTIPSNYFETIGDICKILRGLILNKRILPQEHISSYANSFINNSQYCFNSITI